MLLALCEHDQVKEDAIDEDEQAEHPQEADEGADVAASGGVVEQSRNLAAEKLHREVSRRVLGDQLCGKDKLTSARIDALWVFDASQLPSAARA